MSVQLEIILRRGYGAGYWAELQLARSGDEGDVVTTGPLAPDFDPDKLPPVGDGVDYGLALGDALLHDPRIRSALAQATTAAGTDFLRVRLHVHPDAAALYRVAWEAARDRSNNDPDGQLLFAGERLVFSRYISSSDGRPLYRRSPGQTLRVLLAVSSPANIDKYSPGGQQLAPIDEGVEVRRIQEALQGIGITDTLLSSDTAVTLNALVHKLGDDYDVLVLVCHGALDQSNRPRVYLEKEDRTADVVDGDEMVRRLSELRARPRLVVLASCKSAGAAPDEEYGANGAFAPLGPRLADAGIPAVIAMQGNIAMETVNDFVPAFFKELAEDGCVDRAMSMARSGVRRKRRDWWAPSLLTRLRTGEIFRRTGFEGTGDAKNFQYWKALVAAVANRKCTPILGPALLERHAGTRRELAQRLAGSYRTPLPRAERDVLSLLTQQLGTTRGVDGVRRELLLLVMNMVRERFSGLLPQNLADALPANADPEALVGRMRDTLDFAAQRDGPEEPHAILARLPFALYVSANPDTLMEQALQRERAGAGPVTEILRWHPEHDAIPSIYATEKDYKPSTARPLVYHFFGSAAHQESIAITQDHFLDALIAASRKDVVPAEVRSGLSSRTLLFLGFQPDDWTFRTLFRFILRQEGAALLQSKDKIHVSVQIDPEENEFDDPEIARRYLAQYLGDERISIYWGSVGDFLVELERQYSGAPAAAPGAGTVPGGGR
jgi:CHAT domain/SIR2-like domain